MNLSPEQIFARTNHSFAGFLRRCCEGPRLSFLVYAYTRQFEQLPLLGLEGGRTSVAPGRVTNTGGRVLIEIDIAHDSFAGRSQKWFAENAEHAERVRFYPEDMDAYTNALVDTIHHGLVDVALGDALHGRTEVLRFTRDTAGEKAYWRLAKTWEWKSKRTRASYMADARALVDVKLHLTIDGQTYHF
jgi:hypothetical protein